MRLVLLGPPGSGKGTQAKLLSQRLNLELIGTGDILRTAIARHSPLGEKARPHVEAGGLVPDDLVNDLVVEHFLEPGRHDRFLMDGYPRTLAQAEAFDRFLNQRGLDLTAVILLEIPDEEILHRLTGRWSCPALDCQATYHVETNPPRRSGVCDDCGSVLVQRVDDQPQTVRERLAVYHQNIVELAGYYRNRHLLHVIPGHGEIELVYNHIRQVFHP